MMVCPVKSGVTQKFLLELGPFHTFFNDRHEIKSPLRKFADDTELSSAIDTTGCKHATQGDWHNFKKWVHENLTKLNKSKGFSSLSDLEQLSTISCISCIF